MTSTTATELYEKALTLPDDERPELVERLAATLGDANDDTSDEMLATIQRRLARIDRGEATLIPSADVKAEVMRRMAERSP